MAINKSHPMHFTPRGLVDSFDSTERFPGACQSLVNLVFDQSNPELVVSRPGVQTLINLAANGFLNAGFVSIHVTIGTRVYGMVATSRNAGHDEPFCFDTSTNLIIPITGVTAANTPTSPSTAGDWTPPTMANVGVMVIVTHPGFPGTAGKFFGIIDITNPAAPAWSAANTVTTLLPAVPTAVANFNNRAYFVVPPNKLYYTDELTNPPTITVATQVLTVGDTQACNALSGLPLQTTSSGVVAALTVFKRTQCWQVTGDTQTSDLALNFLSLEIGTNAPRSVAQSAYGIYFSSDGGPYFINPVGGLLPLTHSLNELEPDLTAPFQNALVPTRWAAAYVSSIYRVCGQTIIRGQGVTNDYWFDEHKRRWNGPHTFVYDCASAIGGYFVLSSINNPGQLLISKPRPLVDTLYSDLGTPISFTLLSSTFPKTGDMLMKQVAESQIEVAAGLGGITYTVEAQDDQGVELGTAVISVPTTGSLWGAFVWGDGTLWSYSHLWGGGALWGSTLQGGSNGIWGSAQQIPHTYPVPWPQPFVFEKMQLLISGTSNAQVGIGTFMARYQKTGWMTLGGSPT